MLNIAARSWSPRQAHYLQQHGLSPFMARLYAARGVEGPEHLCHNLHELEPYQRLKNAEAAGERLADAIARREKIIVIGDYDADGATACALTVAGLRALGAEIGWLVPNRFESGYGLNPDVVDMAAQRHPDLIITVDNGIAALDGVAAARAHGIEVLVTDHHLPGAELPEALIVNPNQPGCPFSSKALAGVGVAFYVVMATRAELRRRGAFTLRPEPPLADLLDLVALGTVADVVKLDANNRLLVEQGLKRIRAGGGRPGIAALFHTAKRDPARATAQDLGFVVGPRLNAAGRLEDMSLGVACLLADDEATALRLARELDALNLTRREIEADMQAQAEVILEDIDIGDSLSLTLFDPGWHQGVIGLLASRLKERHHRPTVIFADGGDGWLRGSGRSIAALHLRDALDLVDRRHPGLIARFGGHAAAAGLTLAANGLDTFRTAFEAVSRELIGPGDIRRLIETDGELTAHEFTLDNAQDIRQAVWGQGFAFPVFHGRFRVSAQRGLGERHLKLRLTGPDIAADAVLFNQNARLPEQIRAVYRLEVNEWNGTRSLQCLIEHWEPAA